MTSSTSERPGFFEIDAAPGGQPVSYKTLNEAIHRALADGHRNIRLNQVCGQRFIGAALQGDDVHLEIDGVPGNDLGIFMDGPTIEVLGNAEDQVGNTMNAGTIIVHGSVGDVMGLSARGGTLFVKEKAGFRTGIHVKEYRGKRPVLVIGGKVKDYFGEYMAGGILVALGMKIDPDGQVREHEHAICGNCLGSGIHNGAIYLRTDELPEDLLGVGAKCVPFTAADKDLLAPLVRAFCRHFHVPEAAVWRKSFLKVVPESKRPFRGNYCATII